MPLESMTNLPDDARIWVFGTGRALQADETEALLTAVDGFLRGWQAHGHPLRAAREWREGRFLIVGVDERTAPPSGCSIDALVRELAALENRFGTTVVGHGAVWYRDEAGDVRRVSRSEFRALLKEGSVGGDTMVFDNTMTRLHQVRSGQLEKRAADSWHARAFRLAASVADGG